MTEKGETSHSGICKEAAHYWILNDPTPFYRPTAIRVFPLFLTYSKGVSPPSEV
jgi:hypothetical protein